jgi:hypothetical protein
MHSRLRSAHPPLGLRVALVALVADLGELEPGTYTITDATGGAAAITVVVA